MIMKIGVYVNKNRDFGAQSALKFMGIAEAKGVQIILATGVEEFVNIKAYSLDEVAQNCDILVVFGGDGTMLSVARRVVKYDIALLGVNKGKLGFLTECEDTDFEDLIDRLIAQDYNIEKRAMLNVSVGGKIILHLMKSVCQGLCQNAQLTFQ